MDLNNKTIIVLITWEQWLFQQTFYEGVNINLTTKNFGVIVSHFGGWNYE